MKKLISLITAFSIIATTFGVRAQGEGITLSIACGSQMPVDTVATLSINMSVEAAHVDIEASYNAGTSFDVVGSYTDYASSNIVTTFEEYEKLLRAVAYNDDGDVVATSQPIEVVGLKEIVVRQVWDESFDGAGIIADNGDKSVVYISRDGARIFNDDGNSLQGHYLASKGADIQVKYPPVDSSAHRDSVYLKSTSSATTEFNALWTAITGDYAVFELDFLFEGTSVDCSLMDFKAISNGVESWLANGVHLSNGKIAFGGSSMAVERNKWYSVRYVLNCATGDTYVTVNNEYLGCANNGSISKTVRLSTDAGYGNNVMWFDNYSARQVTYKKAAEKRFSINSIGGAKHFYIGESARFSADFGGYRDATLIRYLSSTDGVNYSIVDTLDANNAEVSIPIEAQTIYVKAELLSADNSLLAQTDPAMLSAKKLITLSNLWNIDFETNSFRIRDAGGNKGMISQVVTKADGDDAKNVNDEQLECYRGSLDNIMSIENCDFGGRVSKVVRLFSTDGSVENKFNRWGSLLKNNIAVFSIDALVATPADTTELAKVQVSTEGGSVDAVTVALRNNKLMLLDDTQSTLSSIPFETYRWYNIKIYVNMDENTVRCSIDGACLGEFKLAESLGNITATELFSAGISGTDNAEVFFDNFVVSQEWELPSILSVSKQGTNSISLTLDSAIRGDMASIVKEITIQNKGMSLAVSDYQISTDGKTVTLTSFNEIPTAVDLVFNILFTTGDEASLECATTPNDFDVTHVIFAPSSKQCRVSARVQNNTDSAHDCIMVVNTYGDDNQLLATYTTSQTISPNTSLSELSLNSILAGKYYTAFFLNGFDDGSLFKNNVYISDSSYTSGTDNIDDSTVEGISGSYVHFNQSGYLSVISGVNLSAGSPLTLALSKTEHISMTDLELAEVIHANKLGSVDAKVNISTKNYQGKYNVFLGYTGTDFNKSIGSVIIYDIDGDLAKKLALSLSQTNSADSFATLLSEDGNPATFGIDSDSIDNLNDKFILTYSILKGEQLAFTPSNIVDAFNYADAVIDIKNGSSVANIMRQSASVFDADYTQYTAIASDKLDATIKAADYTKGRMTLAQLKALSDVKNVSFAGELKGVIEGNASVLGIDISGSYAKLKSTKQNQVMSVLLKNVASANSLSTLVGLFDNAVLDATKDNQGGGSSGGGGSSKQGSSIPVILTPSVIPTPTPSQPEATDVADSLDFGSSLTLSDVPKLISAYCGITREEASSLFARMRNALACGSFSDVSSSGLLSNSTTESYIRGLFDSLGINSNVSDTTTCGEFLTTVLGLFNIESPSYERAVSLGLIDSVDTFYPETPITVTDAMVILVKALGYQSSAQRNGGLPNGYIAQASSLGLYNGLSISGDSFLDKASFYTLMANVLDADVCSVTALTDNDTVLASTVDKSIIELYYDLTTVKGIVTSNEYSYLYNANNSNPVGVIGIDDEEYYINGDAPALGCYIEAYVHQDIDSAQIVFYTLRKNTVWRVPLRDASLTSDGKLTVTTDGKTKRYSLQNDFACVYNGKAYSGLLSDVINQSGDGYILLVTRNRDSAVGLVDIHKSQFMTIGTLDRIDKRILDKKLSGGIYYSNDDVKLIVSGSSIGVDSLQAGDVIEYYASQDHLLYNINVLSDVVSGSVTSSYDDILNINGIDYRTSGYFVDNYQPTLRVGTEVDFVISTFGYLVTASVPDTSDYPYAYLMAVFDKDEEERIYARVYTDAGVSEQYEVSDKLTIDGVTIGSRNIYSALGVYVNQLVRIRLDKQTGKLRYVHTDQTPSDFVNLTGATNYFFKTDTIDDASATDELRHYRYEQAQSNTMYYKSSGYFVPYFTIDNQTKIFCVMNESTASNPYDRVYIGTGTTFLPNDESVKVSDIIPYNVDKSGYASAVVYKTDRSTMPLNSESSYGVVSNIFRSVDRDGEISITIELYTDDSFKTIYAKDDEAWVRSIAKKDNTLPFEKGDVIRYTTRNGYLKDAPTIDFDGTKREVMYSGSANSSLHYIYGRLYDYSDNSITILDEATGTIKCYQGNLSLLGYVDNSNIVVSAPRDRLLTYRQDEANCSHILLKCNSARIVSVIVYEE